MSEPQTYVYKGYDGVIMSDIGTLGDIGKQYIMARVETFEVITEQNLDEFYQIGSKYAKAIHESNAKISGTINKAIWEPTMMRFIVGSDDPTNRRSEISETRTTTFTTETDRARRSPEFDIVGLLRSEVNNEEVIRIVVKRAKLARHALKITPNDFVMENCSYKALGFQITGKFNLKNKFNV